MALIPFSLPTSGLLNFWCTEAPLWSTLYSLFRKADEVKVGPYPQDEILQTHVTPVPAEALLSLQDLMIQQDINSLHKTSKQSLCWHVYKLANITRISFIKGT